MTPNQALQRTAATELVCQDGNVPAVAAAAELGCSAWGEVSVFSHFQRLLEDLPFIREDVDALESPNPEDDRSMKCGIVGYCYFLPLESWGQNEYEFLDQRRQEVVELGELWTEFVCLASGYLLGMYQAGMCDGQDRDLYEAELPGFMWLHSNRFTTQPENV